MSASIDKEDSTDPGGGARDVLASWLDAHAAGECDSATMERGFLDVCRRNGEAPWDALALLDQYQRRGKLEGEVARTLKSEIAQMVFGVPTESGEQTRASPPSTESSGTRWRRPDPPSAADDEESAEEEEEEEEVEAAPRPTASRPSAATGPAAARPLSPPVLFPTRPENSTPRAPTLRRVAHSPKEVLRERYELRGVLGRGSDGVVYRALDRNRQQLAEPMRYVALKVLNPGASPESLIEYQRRAHQAQALVHPHIVRVLDLDHDGETHFIVMELLQGESLDALLSKEPRIGISQDRALKITADIGSVLAYAHEHGVIVGNLTPRKLIVTPAGDAKLIDVGFATASRSSDVSDPARTEAELLYAARYASAERVSGEPLTTSDDVYSFACIVYELLSGRHPYDGRSGAIARVQLQRPDPIATLPRQGWSALERALRWTRSERDLTVSQLIAALTGTAVQQSDVSIRAPRRDTDETTPKSRKGLWLGAVAFVVLAGVMTWRFMPAPELAQVRSDIAAMTQSVQPSDTDVQPQLLPPTSADTARTLENEQMIPAQPAGSATGPSALEAITPPPASTESPAATAPTATEQPGTNPPESNAGEQKVEANQVPNAALGSRGVIGFPKDTYVVRESDVVVRIPVTRARGTRGEVSFRWSIQGNSAEAGADFAAIGPATEYIPAGQNSAVLHIPLVSDNEREGTEMFLVHIDEVGGGARAGELTRAAVILVDDD